VEPELSKQPAVPTRLKPIVSFEGRKRRDHQQTIARLLAAARSAFGRLRPPALSCRGTQKRPLSPLHPPPRSGRSFISLFKPLRRFVSLARTMRIGVAAKPRAPPRRMRPGFIEAAPRTKPATPQSRPLLSDGRSWREIMDATGCSRTLLVKIARDRRLLRAEPGAETAN
jgi:hypothetical protein